MEQRMRTEERNPNTTNLDRVATVKALEMINAEDQTVAGAVRQVLPAVAAAVDRIVAGMARGGRLIYVGAGTSGRLGILDAVECPPTFGVEPQLVVGLIAGGPDAIFRAIEGSEDSETAAELDVSQLNIGPSDSLVGLAASGRTPYTCAALRSGSRAGALTVGISCSPGSELARVAEIAIEVDTGPEVIAGSTRLKAGTAQKMILNMISTCVMVRLGHVYENLMVNVQLTNEKLYRRGQGIIQTVTGCSPEEARGALDETGSVKTSIAMIKMGITADEARRLQAGNSSLRAVLGED
jgi:N-acetylmuramic acid 6-phosphate etherase